VTEGGRLSTDRFLQTLQIVSREGKHLAYSWGRLYSQPIDADWVRNLEAHPAHQGSPGRPTPIRRKRRRQPPGRRMIPQVGLCYECRDRIPTYTPNPCGSVAFGYPSFSDTPTSLWVGIDSD
jgi:hypothetical protein